MAGKAIRAKELVRRRLMDLGYAVADVEKTVRHSFPRVGVHTEDCFGFGDLLVIDRDKPFVALLQVTVPARAADHRAKMEDLAACRDWTAHGRRTYLVLVKKKPRARNVTYATFELGFVDGRAKWAAHDLMG